MKTLSIEDTTEIQLDWLVGQLEKNECQIVSIAFGRKMLTKKVNCDLGVGEEIWSPSTDFSQGGPIIEREMISVNPVYVNGKVTWVSDITIDTKWSRRQEHTQLLVSAMRCYVVPWVGCKVKVPDELLNN